jgi:hypothetical protein
MEYMDERENIILTVTINFNIETVLVC